MIAILLAVAFGITFTLFTTPFFIRLFRKIGWGQFIRLDGPRQHAIKRGTPTMGGLVIVVASIISYFLANFFLGLSVEPSGLLVIFMFVGMSLVGFLDDILKVRKQHSGGLGPFYKVVLQSFIAVPFALLAFLVKDARGIPHSSMSISFARDTGINFSALFSLGIIGVFSAWVLYLLWVNLIAVSSVNAVNITDGLDGLAAGAMIFTMLAYVVIGFWQSGQNCARKSLPLENISKCYSINGPLDMSILAAAILGSLLGFLWWNTNPSKIMMGDTGALALGGAAAALSILTHTQLLFLVLGGLFVIEAGSVILQIAFYKKYRRRIFLMSPLHHHFELKGWAEITVVVRFWIIAGLFTALGIGLFYADWLYS